MATRKGFSSGPVGTARFELKLAQLRNSHKPSRAAKRAVVSAEKSLLRAIDIRKGRKRGKK